MVRKTPSEHPSSARVELDQLLTIRDKSETTTTYTGMARYINKIDALEGFKLEEFAEQFERAVGVTLGQLQIEMNVLTPKTVWESFPMQQLWKKIQDQIMIYKSTREGIAGFQFAETKREIILTIAEEFIDTLFESCIKILENKIAQEEAAKTDPSIKGHRATMRERAVATWNGEIASPRRTAPPRPASHPPPPPSFGRTVNPSSPQNTEFVSRDIRRNAIGSAPAAQPVKIRTQAEQRILHPRPIQPIARLGVPSAPRQPEATPDNTRRWVLAAGAGMALASVVAVGGIVCSRAGLAAAGYFSSPGEEVHEIPLPRTDTHEDR